MKETWVVDEGILVPEVWGLQFRGSSPWQGPHLQAECGPLLRIMVLHAQVEIHGIAKNTNYADS